MNSTEQEDIAQGAVHWFRKGMEAMDHRNWEYALKCLTQSIRLNPSDLEARKQKHRSSRRKFGKGRQASKVATVKLAAIRSRIRTASMRNDWQSVDKLAEDGNALHPWDPEFYALIARAATQSGYLDIARYAWSSALKIDTGNARYFREFGGVLQRLGEFELARSCYRKIDDIDPTGRMSAELVAAVDVASVIQDGGYAGAKTTRDVAVVDPDDIPCDGIEIDDEDIILDYDVGAELKDLVEAGENHVKSGRLCSAIETYRNAVEISPQNMSIRRRLEDVELAYLRQEAVTAQENSRQNPQSAEARSTATARLNELTERERSIREVRVGDAPEDPLFAFQLADLYRRSARFHDAVSLFQKSVTVKELQAESLIGLGECLIHTEQASVGHRHLIAALRMIHTGEKPNAFKLAHYWLGRLYEAQSYLEKATEHFLIIQRLDRGFRDVPKRLERLETTCTDTTSHH